MPTGSGGRGFGPRDSVYSNASTDTAQSNESEMGDDADEASRPEGFALPLTNDMIKSVHSGVAACLSNAHELEPHPGPSMRSSILISNSQAWSCLRFGSRSASGRCTTSTRRRAMGATSCRRTSLNPTRVWSISTVTSLHVTS